MIWGGGGVWGSVVDSSVFRAVIKKGPRIFLTLISSKKTLKSKAKRRRIIHFHPPLSILIMAISAKTCAITATVGFAAAVAVLYITKDDKIETTLTGKEVKKLFDELFMQMQKCVAARAKEVQTQAAMLAQQVSERSERVF